MSTRTRCKPLAECKLSPRRIIRSGDLVRFGGGGDEYVDGSGQRHRLPIRGTWQVDDVVAYRSRTWLVVTEIDKGIRGACRTVLVAGKPRRVVGVSCLVMRPYKVRRIGGGS